MKRDGFVKDEWISFAASVVPGIKAHTFHITDQGRKELKFSHSTAEEREFHPLGWRILLFMSHGGLMTIGQVAKMVDKGRGHVRGVMQSLQNKGLVECLTSSTRTTIGWDAIIYLYRITEAGRKVPDSGPAAYDDVIKRRKGTEVQ
jgi:hypothetical protein